LKMAKGDGFAWDEEKERVRLRGKLNRSGCLRNGKNNAGDFQLGPTKGR